jgi:hypothetical protein
MKDIRERLLEFEDESANLGISHTSLDRMAHINGFVMEEQLYWRLVDIARNPQRLIETTKMKID